MQADSMQIYREADEALTEAHALAPADPKILYALAHVEVDEQNTTAAEANLRAYLKAMPDDPPWLDLHNIDSGQAPSRYHCRRQVW